MSDIHTIDENNNDNHSSSSCSSESQVSTLIDDKKSNNKNGMKKLNTIGTQESRDVNRLRIFVLLVLVFAGVIVCFLVYKLSWNSLYEQFNTQYVGQAEQIQLAFTRIPYEKFGSLGSLRVSAIGEAMDKNATWPYYFMSSFEKRAAVVRRLSETIYVGLYPYITDATRPAWEEYAASVGPSWINTSLTYQSKVGIEVFGSIDQLPFNESQTSWPILESNPDPNSENYLIPDAGPGPYLPMWQASPLTTTYLNFNYLKININNMNGTSEPLLSIDNSKAVTAAFQPLPPGSVDSVPVSATNYYAGFLSSQAGKEVFYEGDPISDLYLPVAKSFNDNTTVAVIIAVIHWASYFDDLLPANAKDISVIINDSCTEPSTFIVRGNKVIFVGKGDSHETYYDDYMRSASWNNLSTIQDGTEFGLPYLNSHCPPSIIIYPTTAYTEQFNTKQPIYMTITVALVFVFAIFVFIAYDRLVERRQNLVLTKALQSTAIVSSLFPQNIAERLMNQQQTAADDKNKNKMNNNQRLRAFVANGEKNLDDGSAAPIADLFPNATVFFADISGFTAWSSTREPAQVFILLQNVYQAFDHIANRRKVFKIETIGDCYVAVTGCPEIQDQHAIVMARFATDCQRKMVEVTSSLCVTLGPDTNELAMRIGMHSGPVTAGVLQGDRARFQLFGDTVNTASRMESTGIKNKIQVSETTASCLVQAGKSHWLTLREDHIHAKGKGIMTTYWLNINSSKSNTLTTSSQTGSSDPESNMMEIDSVVPVKVCETTEKLELSIDWICEILQSHIKTLVATRCQNKSHNRIASQKAVFVSDGVHIPMDEVVETIYLPDYKYVSAAKTETLKELPSIVSLQLRQYISVIAKTYRDNPFHNFQHSCHVTLSVSKLLTRIVNPNSDVVEDNGSDLQSDFGHHMHDYTYGINSDEITILAIMLSAVVHDVDHRGVSNVQLMKEEASLGELYRSKSVAEQNSLDIAWSLLISDQFEALRDYIFVTQDEVNRFRQVFVNTVLATDIMDKELNELRRKRWTRAFATDSGDDDECRRNLKATIVIEHLIQASDVAHTMQHWHVYRKWNKSLFQEMYIAYQCGRMVVNPCDFWYKGELGFFDNYIIPLAKQLKDCNVFGVSSDEYLNYAEKNRAEWEVRGTEIVSEMMLEFSNDSAEYEQARVSTKHFEL